MEGLSHIGINTVYVRERYHFNETKNITHTDTIKTPSDLTKALRQKK